MLSFWTINLFVKIPIIMFIIIRSIIYSVILSKTLYYSWLQRKKRFKYCS